MLISVIALTVAALSLSWNIVSTTYTWRTTKPVIKIYGSWMGGTLPTQSGKVSTEWLRIVASNVGRTATSVTSITVWPEYAPAGKGKKKTGLIGFGIETVDEVDESISGPLLPYTIEPSHSGEWYFDLVGYLGPGLIGDGTDSEKLLVEIELGSGQSLQKEIDVSERYPVIADEYRSRTLRKGNSQGNPSGP